MLFEISSHHKFLQMIPNKEIQRMQFYAHSILKGYNLQLKDIKYILERVQNDIFMKEPNVLSINPPLYVIGGISGNFDDLLSVFDIGGPLPYSSYLFLGNFTENNGNSLKTILLLFVYKYLYKENLFLIRGTNENELLKKQVNDKEREKIPVIAKNINYPLNKEIMHFYEADEAKEIWELIISTINAIPIAAVVGQLYFCTDSQFKLTNAESLSIELIRRIDRKTSSKCLTPITSIMKKFLEHNRLNFLITGLNSTMPQDSSNPLLFKVYSSPHTISSNCYIIEINENKIAKKIKMRSISEERSNVYSLSNEIFL